jgi:tetratricopeptide (TPR) repeat protein
MVRRVWLSLLLVACNTAAGPPPAMPEAAPVITAADGDLHFEAERWADAAAAYDRALAAGAALDVSHRIRAAIAHERAGDRDKAFGWISRALDVGPRAEALARRPELAALVADPRWARLAGAQAAPCSSEEHRQLDFWVGRWKVTGPDGAVVGENVITVDLAGCRVHESWSGAGGGRGQSINWFDPGDRRWHQLWLDESGMVIAYTGEVDEHGALALAGESTLRDGTRVRSRMTLRREGAKVRQLIEQSIDGGASWQTWFDGTYRTRE